MTIFSTLQQALLPNEALSFKIEAKNDHLIVLLQPILREASDSIPEEAEQARANLCRPLRMSLPAAELDAQFPEIIERFTQSRRGVRVGYESMLNAFAQEQKAAADQASKAASERAQRKSKTAPAKPAGKSPATTNNASTTDTPAPSVEASGPQQTGLF